MNNQGPNSGFIEISLCILFECKKGCVKKALITAPAAASCCFILMSGVMAEAEMYDTSNKRSLDLSKFKKGGCLNF